MPLDVVVPKADTSVPEAISGGFTPFVRAKSATRWLLAILSIGSVIFFANLCIEDPKLSRAAIIAGICMVLWFSEVVPSYAGTLVMWAAIPLLLGPLNRETFAVTKVLAVVLNPILLLFFTGLALSVAGTKFGIDAWIATTMVRASGGRRRLLLGAIMGGTACLSMWMSNIAAAAMMIATLKPLFAGGDGDVSFRRALLLGVAFAADFGGMGTPIGSGPNLIAIAAISPTHAIDFFDWMKFGVPFAIVLVVLSYGIIVWKHRVVGRVPPTVIATPRLTLRGWSVVGIFVAVVSAWLLEPLHGLSAAVVGLVGTVVLFGTRLLNVKDLTRIDWATLLLIAGGLTLGELFETSGMARAMAGSVAWHQLSPRLVLLLMVAACAILSSLASNTAASAMMIQIGLGILPSPGYAILIALAASMGVPFAISTPPNAMAYGQGVLRSHDLLLPGLVLMVGGCGLIVFAGPAVLRWCGIP